MPAGVRGRLFRWAAWGVVLVVAVVAVLLAPAVYADVSAHDRAFLATKRKIERLVSIVYWKSPEQKRLMKGLDGPAKAAAAPARTYYVPKH